MDEEPASYRAGTASFDLHVGSAFKAILPGAFQGSVIGSLLVAAYATFIAGSGGAELSLAMIASAVMTFCFVMIIAIMAGMIVCSIFIALIGFPLALAMRRRIATPGALIVTLIVATGTALVTSHVAYDPGWAVEFHPWIMTGLTLAYAIPAGIAYRQAIITERMLSFWSTAAD